MKILSIETSCDETALSIVEAEGGVDSPSFHILANALFSQIDIHKEFGGVYPMIAKREHGKNLPILLKKILEESKFYKNFENNYSEDVWTEVEKILSREDGVFIKLRELVENIKKPEIDLISVTSGPGLAPALWVGITFAQALGKLWDVPVIGTNHMEGHIASVLIESADERKVDFPALALLISGGHTELVNIEGWGKYEVIGSTQDDAVGEAYDKAARMMGLPYPGGPEMSRLSQYAEDNKTPYIAKLPRPMLHSGNMNFSFSGLKTAVLYYIRDNFKSDGANMTQEEKADLAREFDNAVIEVLMSKTEKALAETGAKTLIVAGGVIANKRLQQSFLSLEGKYPDLAVKLPAKGLSTDNSLMIASAAYLNICLNPKLLEGEERIVAEGNLKLSTLNLN